MAEPSGRLVLELGPTFKQRLRKVARFVGDGTMHSYVRELLERRVDEDEQALAPILERLAQEQQQA